MGYSKLVTGDRRSYPSLIDSGPMAAQQQVDFPLPPDLPEPVDDGAADHLPGMPIPHIALRSTGGRIVDLGALSAPRTLIYCYPMTGVPNQPLPQGWDRIPGARGCTPQTRGFRDHYEQLKHLNAEVFGLSTQTTEYQQEMAARLQLPFEVLSDSDFRFANALGLPTFTVEGTRFLKRLTLMVRDSRVEHVFYPVFPPNQSADQVLRWLEAHPLGASRW